MELFALLLPLAFTAGALWLYRCRELQVDRRLRFDLKDRAVEMQPKRKHVIRSIADYSLGFGLLLALLVVMEAREEFVSLILGIVVICLSIVGLRVRIWPNRARGATVRELFDLGLLFLAVVAGIGLTLWQMVDHRPL